MCNLFFILYFLPVFHKIKSKIIPYLPFASIFQLHFIPIILSLLFLFFFYSILLRLILLLSYSICLKYYPHHRHFFFSFKTHLPLCQSLYRFFYLLKLFPFIAYLFTKESLVCCLLYLSTLKSDFFKLSSAFPRTLTLLVIQRVSSGALLFQLLLSPNQTVSPINWHLECYFFQ